MRNPATTTTTTTTTTSITLQDLRLACQRWDDDYPERRRTRIVALTGSAVRMVSVSVNHISERIVGGLLLIELATDPRNFRLVKVCRALD
jgi:hypothetical protein